MIHNRAFIDGQNLYLGTSLNNWKVDLKRFRLYLKDKYNVLTAYYFLGYKIAENEELYTSIAEAGFILMFREHNPAMMGKKKGNVDTDVVFEICKGIIDRHSFDKVLLVSGDGDYKKLVDYLIQKQRFLKILFPNSRFASSLYNALGDYCDALDKQGVRDKIRLL
ncbi:MAG: hypothetical protein RJB39_605 [Candidatus Parcubacteria bacterium]|jgi:uncharacterized LabA/DUF88 family protein